MSARSPPEWRSVHRTHDLADGTVADVELRGDLSVVAGRPVLALSGVVDLATIPTLRDLLLRAGTEHPHGSLAVDLDAVEVLDDTGLGLLLGAAGRRREHGGDLVVVTTRGALIARLAANGFDRAVRVAPALAEVTT